MIIIVMGVSGSGKSTIAKRLASKLKYKYVDADNFHSTENVQKMASGIALNDEDRKPWLAALRYAIQDWLSCESNVVLACSALKREYRQILTVDASKQCFAYLKGSPSLFASRLTRRKTHFMKENMLASQFQTLEEPADGEAIICDAGKTVLEIVHHIMAEIASRVSA